MKYVLQFLVVLFAIPTGLMAQIPTSGGKPVPFVYPDDYRNEAQRQRVKAEGTKTMLRFGYLSEAKDAEALRGQTIYNRQGNVLEENLQDFNGNLSKSIRISYFPGGLKMKSFTATRNDEKGNFDQEFSWKFDEDGRIIEYRFKGRQQDDFSEQYAYREDGKILFKRTFLMDDTPGPFTQYEYDDSGNLIQATNFGFENLRLENVVYSWEGDKLMTEIHYNSRGVVTSSASFTYNSEGRLAKKSTDYGNGLMVQEETWGYSPDGDTLLHTLQMSGEEGMERDVYKVDAQGRRIEHKSYDPDGELFTWFTYEWDSTGTGAGWARLHPNGKVSSRFSEVFDKENRIIKRAVYTDEGRNDEEEHFTYDDKGRPQEHTVYKFRNEWAVYWFVFESH